MLIVHTYIMLCYDYKKSWLSKIFYHFIYVFKDKIVGIVLQFLWFHLARLLFIYNKWWVYYYRVLFKSLNLLIFSVCSLNGMSLRPYVVGYEQIGYKYRDLWLLNICNTYWITILHKFPLILAISSFCSSSNLVLTAQHVLFVFL